MLGLRSYPVDRDKLKKEWDTMKKDDNKITNKTFDVRVLHEYFKLEIKSK